ncbi:uncharacterized protein LOC127795692 isoform X2 [Diospyros lotus]|uniref:uncharacterized protein LOC127795692 isoform X2 n=1 Tax=Diospyros lotus TaxID=55363 RepID=UPI00224CFDD2|nr:uncharacterized protein LOC127795692 isoform X2 [Diospyros lotus]
MQLYFFIWATTLMRRNTLRSEGFLSRIGSLKVLPLFHIPKGRSWKASELRLKSWDDLHKLWYVLLKEKNMLMTQRQMLYAQNLKFSNPERIPKVRKSMCRIKQVLTERAIVEPDSRRSAEMKRMINAL